MRKASDARAEIGCGAVARGLARFGKGGPRAAEDGDADGRQLNDAIDALQQGAVVAGDEDAALPALEQLRDRLPAIGIEIVGGFIEQQHVRRLDQEARQCDARSFAAAQGSDRTIERQRRQAGFNQRRLYPGRQRPVRVCRVIERTFATFEPVQTREIAGDAERLADRQALIGQLREHADRAGALQRSA